MVILQSSQILSTRRFCCPHFRWLSSRLRMWCFRSSFDLPMVNSQCLLLEFPFFCWWNLHFLSIFSAYPNLGDRSLSSHSSGAAAGAVVVRCCKNYAQLSQSHMMPPLSMTFGGSLLFFFGQSIDFHWTKAVGSIGSTSPTCEGWQGGPISENHAPKSTGLASSSLLENNNLGVYPVDIPL